jgi:hypothetical protein
MLRLRRRSALRLSAALAIACGAAVGAQQPLPQEPARGFGVGITGSFDGWFDNPDGTRSFLLGYLNRNRSLDMDVPIGPNNHIDPGGPDLGQPTHFLAGRQMGMFVVTVPKTFAADQRLTWTITVNGQTSVIPMRLHEDYNISPMFELAHKNTPPTVHLFEQSAPGIAGPIAQMSRALLRKASVSRPFDLPLWAEDDAHLCRSCPEPSPRRKTPPVTLIWSQYRGTGKVTFDKDSPDFETLKGGSVDEPYAGKATTAAHFSTPGDYTLHVVTNDYSGLGGRGVWCCWTTALVNVSVTP